jgi:DNA-directed RNA polymerase specialized sigma24 family protein
MSDSPAPDAALRAGLTAAYRDAVRRASALIRGLRPPRPSPEELVNEAVAKVLSAARGRTEPIENPKAYLFTAIAHLVRDVIRGYPRALELVEELPEAAEAPRPAVGTSRLTLNEKELAVLHRIHVVGDRVDVAFAACGWDSKSPYYEHKKLLARIWATLEEVTP